ncbi:MAG: 2Fe-2S iron-sulfur cluster-binding protein [Hyphomicrobiaceae bacterium]
MPETEGAPKTPLVVARAELAAEDIMLFELARADGGELPEFTPGAHVEVEVPGGLLRKYSLANDPAERDSYQIAVKRERGGRGGSQAMLERVKAGDSLLVSAPRNDFELKPSPAGYTLIAGGIGITPILSMARCLKSSGAGKFKLYYLTRAREATAFHDELSAPAYRGIVRIHHDGGDPDNGLDLWPVLEKPRGHVYCCGPRGLMQAVRDMTGHWSSGAVHFEAFTDGGGAKPDDKPFQVRVGAGGRVIDVPAGSTILESLRQAGFSVPSSCESGTCGSCKTRLLSGDVEHRDFVLTEDEKARYVMVCVSRAASGDLEIEL